MKTLDVRFAGSHNVATYVATEGGMNFATVRDLKNRTSELLRRVAAGKDVLITSHGRPVAMLHGMTQDDIEDWVLANHPGLRASIEAAERDFRTHGGIPLDPVIRELKRKSRGRKQKRTVRKRR